MITGQATNMRRINNKHFLYYGLGLLFLAIILRFLGVPTMVWAPLFGIAIVLKTIFLIRVFRSKSFQPSLWLGFILTGVAMIFISMIFRYLYPVPWLWSILFYGAIAFKLIGLILMIIKRVWLSSKNK
ncbi:hypothetical protein M2137_003077 [Parabacteroides sp. PFB2-10]|uniref:hypothetical protein n=1 Tax=Parabacteroides sp. PFB2-10 TaxID=1742405 RepID=UPI002475B84B|nr:hypothetical protein [Parabacteroides sp. PFB2-10]MDH6314277.1 hypothetical protein [Parabacteroides sp. PFB2-10]